MVSDTAIVRCALRSKSLFFLLLIPRSLDLARRTLLVQIHNDGDRSPTNFTSSLESSAIYMGSEIDYPHEYFSLLVRSNKIWS